MTKLVDLTVSQIWNCVLGTRDNCNINNTISSIMTQARTTTTAFAAITLVTLVLHVSGVVSFPIGLARWRTRRNNSTKSGNKSKQHIPTPVSWHDIHPTLPLKSGQCLPTISFGVPDMNAKGTQLAAVTSYQESNSEQHSSSTSSLNFIQPAQGQTAGTLHLLVLVHGFKGGAGDLGYLKSQVESLLSQSSSTSSSNNSNNSNNNKLVVHAAKCNEGLTDDGIQAGGERLVREIYDTMRKEVAKMERQRSGSGTGKTTTCVTDVTLSFVGNSMGGLFARYAAARIRDFALQESRHIRDKKKTESESEIEDTKEDDSNNNTRMTMFGRRLHYNIFCSTAAPHLGTASHTYIKLPRTVELGVAFALQQTGRDLFRLNGLLYHMATQPYYLDALASFRKRVAYANAYSTDFMVPTETAAFLNSESHTPHSFLDTKEKQTQGVQKNNQEDENAKNSEFEQQEVKHYRDNPLIVAVLRTENTYVPSSSTTDNKAGDNNSNSLLRDEPQQPTEDGDEMTLAQETNELVEMATKLDSLGWKKVFIDLREDMPVRPLRLQSNGNGNGSSQRRSSNGNNGDSSILNAVLPGFLTNSNSNNNNNGGDTTASSKRAMCQRMQTLRAKQVVESQELVEVLSAKDKISLPLGHNMIVALKKTTTPKIMAVFNQLNQRGQPIMNSLAHELAEDSRLVPPSPPVGSASSDDDTYQYATANNSVQEDTGSTTTKAEAVQ
jgi:hypothetical protein